jgi:hypothetical protein
MAETVYPKGFRTFERRESAPDFVLGTLIINPNEFFAWVKENPGFISEYTSKDGQVSKQLKLNILKSKDGRVNFTVDNYKPQNDSTPF